MTDFKHLNIEKIKAAKEYDAREVQAVALIEIAYQLKRLADQVDNARRAK